VDLQRHQPIALLADRTADTLEAWLKAYPGVEILSRDRSKTYKSSMDNGAPDAIQVADRFHLLQNLKKPWSAFLRGMSTRYSRLRRHSFNLLQMLFLQRENYP
jgi:transposase